MTEDRTPTEGRPDLPMRQLLVKAKAALMLYVDTDEAARSAYDMLADALRAAPAAEPVPLTLNRKAVETVIYEMGLPSSMALNPGLMEMWQATLRRALASPDKGEPRPARDPESPAP